MNILIQERPSKRPITSIQAVTINPAQNREPSRLEEKARRLKEHPELQEPPQHRERRDRREMRSACISDTAEVPSSRSVHDFRLSTASFDFNYAANPIPTPVQPEETFDEAPDEIHEEAESPRSGRFRGDRPNMANAPSENVTGAAENAAIWRNTATPRPPVDVDVDVEDSEDSEDSEEITLPLERNWATITAPEIISRMNSIREHFN